MFFCEPTLTSTQAAHHPTPMHTTDKRHQFIELRSQGWSIYRISSFIDVPKSTLSDWQKQEHAKIQELKAMALEAFEEEAMARRAQEQAEIEKRLAQVEKVLDQKLSQNLENLSIMELCRLSNMLRSQKAKCTPKDGLPWKAMPIGPSEAAETQPGSETGLFRTVPDGNEQPENRHPELRPEEAPTPPGSVEKKEIGSGTGLETKAIRPTNSQLLPPVPTQPPPRIVGHVIDPRCIIGRRNSNSVT